MGAFFRRKSVVLNNWREGRALFTHAIFYLNTRKMKNEVSKGGGEGLPEKVSVETPEVHYWFRLPRAIRGVLHWLFPKKKASMRSLEIEHETKSADGSSRKTKVTYKEKR